MMYLADAAAKCSDSTSWPEAAVIIAMFAMFAAIAWALFKD